MDITDVIPSCLPPCLPIVMSHTIKISKGWKFHRGKYLPNNTLRLESVFKEGMIKQRNADSPFVLWADPRIAKLLDGLCWCCGRARLLINFGENGWQETCIHSGVTDFKPKRCKYAGGHGCVAKGRTDGNCAGKCKDVCGGK